MVDTQEYALVYHWWNNTPNVKPYQDLSNPVILAIATARAYNPKITIYVIDISFIERPLEDWGDFPKTLSFTIIPRKILMNCGLPNCNPLCSRVWDVWDACQKDIPKNNILFTDADVFWLKDMFPLEMSNQGKLNYFHCHKNNTGVWYFDKRSPFVKEVFCIWKGIMALAMVDNAFHEEIKTLLPSAREGFFQEEIAFSYLLLTYPRYYHSLSIRENFLVYELRHRTPEELSRVKCLHCLRSVMGNQRGRACYYLKELSDAIHSTLTSEQMKLIFDDFKPTKVCSIYDIQKMSIDQLIEFTTMYGCSDIMSLK